MKNVFTRREMIAGTALKHHASECQDCHNCEKRCPFHVKVSERMKLAAKLFGV